MTQFQGVSIFTTYKIVESLRKLFADPVTLPIIPKNSRCLLFFCCFSRNVKMPFLSSVLSTTLLVAYLSCIVRSQLQSKVSILPCVTINIFIRCTPRRRSCTCMCSASEFLRSTLFFCSVAMLNVIFPQRRPLD